MLFSLGTWISRISNEDIIYPAPGDPPPAYSCLLCANGASFLLRADSTSKIMRP